MHNTKKTWRSMSIEPDRYASLARWYDSATAAPLRGVRARLAAVCKEQGFSSVVDIGCGTGVLARRLHEEGIAAVCVDASPAMLAVAGKRLPAAVPRVQASLPLPFGANAFDASVLALVLHESEEDPCTVLREALRVAPVCAVMELRMPERNLDLPAQALVHIVERLAGKEHYARFRNFARLGRLRGVAASAGAEIVFEEAHLAGAVALAFCRNSK